MRSIKLGRETERRRRDLTKLPEWPTDAVRSRRDLTKTEALGVSRPRGVSRLRACQREEEERPDQRGPQVSGTVACASPSEVDR